MLIALSYMEVLFFPAVAIALLVGFWLGVRHAMLDEKRALYWRRRARSAEGQLASYRKKENGKD